MRTFQIVWKYNSIKIVGFFYWGELWTDKRRKLRSFLFPIFSLVLVSIEKEYQTLKTASDHISKHVEVRQIYFRRA